MKSYTIAAILLPTVAFAVPSISTITNSKRFSNETAVPPPPTNSGAVCTAGKYQCRQDSDKSWGWDVCDVSSKWVNAGTCAPAETCIFNSLNGSPYCVPTPSKSPAANSGKECYSGKYQCKYDNSKGWAIETCNAAGKWDHTLDCASTETCTYGAVNGYPYCTPKTDARVCTPGAYQCSFVQANGGWGWEVCSAEGKWSWGGGCKSGETCTFNPLNGSPYCV